MPDLVPSQGILSRFSEYLSKACLWLSGAGLCLMTAIIIWQVIARYGFNASPSWSEQAALYILIWTVLFAAAAGVREQFHIRMTVFQDALGERRKIALLLSHLVTFGIGVFLFFYGCNLVLRLWDFAIPTLGLPRGSAFLPMPISGLLIAGFALEHVSAVLSGREVTSSWP